VPDTEVYFIAEAIKRLFHKHGNRKNRYAARLRFL
jgi:sulfite reductase (ferredoxin)